MTFVHDISLLFGGGAQAPLKRVLLGFKKCRGWFVDWLMSIRNSRAKNGGSFLFT